MIRMCRLGGGPPRAMILFTNHLDAWVVTAVISFIALLIHEQVGPRGLLLLSAMTALCWFGFALNDYFDAPYDAQDEKKAHSNFFVQFPVPAQSGSALFLGIGTLLIFAFLPFGWRGLSILFLLFGVAWAYSAPPLRVKSRPGWDLLMHAIFVESFPYFATVFILQLSLSGVDYFAISLLMMASLGAQLEQQMRDFGVDSKFERNFTTTFGLATAQQLLKRINLLMVLLVIAGMAVGIIPWLYVPFLLIGAPAILHRFFRALDQPRSETLVTVSVVTAGIYTAVLLLVKVFG